MPKLEPRNVQKELESGTLWPVYWLYGQERMKSRELLKRIRKAALGDQSTGGGVGLGFGEETLDGSEVKAAQIVDTAQSMSLAGGIRLVVIRDAHAIKDPEELGALLGKPGRKEELGHVCVFLSKDLDRRKKFSKLLLEKAAVVPCEEIPEEEREAWIGYLSKRKGLELDPALVSQLRSLDPWSLDIIEQELEKYSLAGDSEVLLGSLRADQGTEAFLEAFFGRDPRLALSALGSFVESADETLPLLGLLGWNVRYLALVIADQERRTRFAKLSPYLAERFNRWSRHWKLAEMLELQQELAEIDFSMKQTARLPLGLWATLVQRFCPLTAGKP